MAKLGEEIQPLKKGTRELNVMTSVGGEKRLRG